MDTTNPVSNPPKIELKLSFCPFISTTVLVQGQQGLMAMPCLRDTYPQGNCLFWDKTKNVCKVIFIYDHIEKLLK